MARPREMCYRRRILIEKHICNKSVLESLVGDSGLMRQQSFRIDSG